MKLRFRDLQSFISWSAVSHDAHPGVGNTIFVAAANDIFVVINGVLTRGTGFGRRQQSYTRFCILYSRLVCFASDRFALLPACDR